MASKSEPGRSWRRLLAEGVVIVGSILLAFAIQARWEARADAIQEQAFLSALAEDFRVTKAKFDTIRTAHQTVMGSMERLLDYAESGTVPEAERVQMDTVLSRVFYRRTFDPPMGTVQTILGSGRLDLLENQDLISALTSWTAAVEDFKELETAGTDHFYQTLYPYLSANVNLQDLDKGIPEQVPWAHGSTESYQLVSSQEFHNVIYVHWVLYMNVNRAMPGIAAAIERILSMTEADLAG